MCNMIMENTATECYKMLKSLIGITTLKEVIFFLTSESLLFSVENYYWYFLKNHNLPI